MTITKDNKNQQHTKKQTALNLASPIVNYNVESHANDHDMQIQIKIQKN